MSEISPIVEPESSWLEKARSAGRSVQSATRSEVKTWKSPIGGKSTKHYVYAVLLYYPEISEVADRFGIYVGMSHLPPYKRLKNHRRGDQANNDVRKYSVRLLQDVYQHLNPMRLNEARSIERKLFKVLKNANLGWVSMRQNRPLLRRSKAGGAADV